MEHAEVSIAVRAPASSANLGAGFDVLGMAVDLYADVGVGPIPDGAHPLDRHHPARRAFEALGGRGALWLRGNIPMARGLGFSGAVRVAAAGLGAVTSAGGRRDSESIHAAAADILRVAAELEGHGDNVAASLHGGITAFVDGVVVRLTIGPRLAGARFVAWIPDVTTSTDASRRTLPTTVERADAVHNIARVAQFVAAVEHDEPTLLVGAADDRLHQSVRIPAIPGAAAAIAAGRDAGAWTSWLSGSGPTIGFLCDAAVADDVAASLPGGAHTKVLSIDTRGTRLVDDI